MHQTKKPQGRILVAALAALSAGVIGAEVSAAPGSALERAAEKRAAKSLIDVAFDRLGDAVGGGLVRLAVVLAPAIQVSAILWLAMICAAAAILAASRLNRGYIGSLESSLINRGTAVDRSDLEDEETRELMRSLQQRNNSDTRKAKNLALRQKGHATVNGATSAGKQLLLSCIATEKAAQPQDPKFCTICMDAIKTVAAGD